MEAVTVFKNLRSYSCINGMKQQTLLTSEAVPFQKYSEDQSDGNFHYLGNFAQIKFYWLVLANSLVGKGKMR